MNVPFARYARSHSSARGLLGRLAAIDATYRQRVHLVEMDDRMLRDIGVSRADVEREVRRPILL